MRVLHVVSTMTRRGAELFASDLVRVLNEAGAIQHVVVLHPLENETGVAFDAAVTVLGANGWEAPALHLNVPTAVRLRRLIADWNPDVVQAHGGETLKYLTLAGAAPTTPIVYRRIGTAPRSISGGPRRMVYGALMRRASRVVTVADALRRETIQMFGVPARRVVTIPNAVDARRFRPQKRREEMRRVLRIQPDAQVIVSLGALTWEKDPFTHLMTSVNVFRRLPGAMHIFVGDGPLRTELLDRIRQLGLHERVRVLGSRADVPDLLLASDVLLFASMVEGMEGMPASVIEAGMTGLPVVGFRIAGVSEVVEHGVTGFLLPPNDVDGLARCTAEVLTDGRRRRSMGEAARVRCHSLYDIHSIAPRYLELYGHLASK